jgi:hypothetical protein
MSTKFWIQMQAPAGNWVDTTGSNDKDWLAAHVKYLRERDKENQYRVIERQDVVLIAL